MTDCCPGAAEYFDRTLCPDPCRTMHYRCEGCGGVTDDCDIELQAHNPDPDEKPKRTDRGFYHFEEIPSSYGGSIRVCESSNASGPHIWALIECPEDMNKRYSPTIEAAAHITLENATRLRNQLTWLIENHYQVRDG